MAQDAIGLERKAARLRYLRHRWMEQVAQEPGVRFYTADDDTQAGALASMGIDGLGAAELTDILQDRYAIHVRPRFVRDEREGIRVTPYVFTTLDEVDRLAEAIHEIAGGSRASGAGQG